MINVLTCDFAHIISFLSICHNFLLGIFLENFRANVESKIQNSTSKIQNLEQKI